MAAYQYDPATVYLVLVVPGLLTGPLEGFAKGTFITIRREVPTFRLIPGVAGQCTSGRNQSTRGTISFVLEQASPTNLALTAVQALDRKTGAGVFPVGVWDRSSLAEFAGAPLSRLEGMPPNEKGDTPGTVRWRILAPDLLMTHGGLRQV